jgi:hypothetical protein
MKGSIAMFKFFSVFVLFFSTSLIASVLVKDIGIIGLASHDLFTWNPEQEKNLENGRLDLSTIFDYAEGKRWRKGGHRKNAENAPVWSITKRLVDFYRQQLKFFPKEKARKDTVLLFHGWVKESYERLSGMKFPAKGIDDEVNNTEQAVMRALHDILPGSIEVFRLFPLPLREIKLTHFTYAKFYLSNKELDQVIPYYDGQYDKEYRKILIPFAFKMIDLQEKDREFIETYSSFKQEEMLKELAEVGRQEKTLAQVAFMQFYKSLFQKAICPIGNQWMDQTIPCE